MLGISREEGNISYDLGFRAIREYSNICHRGYILKHTGIVWNRFPPFPTEKQ